MEYNSAVQRHFAAPKLARELPRSRPGLVAGEAEDDEAHGGQKIPEQAFEAADMEQLDIAMLL